MEKYFIMKENKIIIYFPKMLCVVLILILLISCSKSASLWKNMGVQRKMQLAEELFAKKKYSKASEIYKQITYGHKGSPYVQEAQYKYAECLFQQKLYEDAKYEFNELITLYPDSPYIETADYRIGVCWWKLSYPYPYDQSETKNALSKFKQYLQLYPEGKYKKEAQNYIKKCKIRILKKKYENGYIYYKLHNYNSALLYLEEIIELNLHNEVDKDALYLAAKVYIEKKEYNKAKNLLQKFLDKYPTDKRIVEIQEMISKSDAKLMH
ncbi:MAG: hypothetical protein DRH57_08140 [Candidatus Cloacimonadota bacterium]|nr:MAG: hypothetical protein DRH57_08140 [Candidatus Cloacimonadota bacterium]